MAPRHKSPGMDRSIELSLSLTSSGVPTCQRPRPRPRPLLLFSVGSSAHSRGHGAGLLSQNGAICDGVCGVGASRYLDRDAASSQRRAPRWRDGGTLWWHM